MHREISHSDTNFTSESPLPLYVFTGFLALLLGIDLYPRLVSMFGGTPPWSGEFLGYRFAMIAAVIGGARILYLSLQGLLDGKLGADLALAIACLAAILMNEPLVAAEVVIIGMLGECLEAYTFSRTQNAIRKIVEVFPKRCWLLKDGQEVRVLTNELQIGDHVVVKPGAKIPVDGVIIDGRSAIDASPLTGESAPVDKGLGDEVLAGSLNQFGALTIEAKRVASQTVAGRVVELTARALKDKTSGERLADQMARFFLPAVLGLAVITFLVGYGYHSRWRSDPLAWRPALQASMYPTLAILVVACPCALILATPAAIMAALARLAGTGVLVKSGRAIEQLARIDALAIDKTGTLTEGAFEVRGVHVLDGANTSAALEQPGCANPHDALLRLAGSAEQPSEHPLGRAVVEAARRRHIPLEPANEFQAHPGAGIITALSHGPVIVGTKRLLIEHGIPWSADADALADTIDAAGQTPLWVASNGQLLGVLGAEDRPRPEAAGVIDQLRAAGIAPIVLLTGDRRAAASALAKELTLTDVAAELLPHQKAERIEALKSTGHRVAMIGDGINDAPALARADVGLAVGGIDLAAEAGDVILLGDPLRHLPLLVRLSRATVAIIRQNILWFAFVVNFLGILITAWLWPLFAPANWLDQSPLAAVIYHQIGSLAVLLNSMRLLWFERAESNAAVAGIKAKMRDADLWIDRTFDLHELSHTLERRWKPLAFIAAILGIILYAATGLTIVAPAETAVVRRFGRPTATLEPGWHWRLPWPIEEATRVSDRVRTVEIGFRENLGGQAPASWTWTSAHRKENRRAEEATMITGDGNLVDVQAVLRYRVIDPQVYLFSAGTVDEILRASAESALRGVVAGKQFQDLLTVDREKFQDEVLARLKSMYESESGNRLGIKLEGLSLLDLHPPGEVVEAYYRVADAMEGRDRRINEAEERAIARRKAAQADTEKIVAGAKASATEKVATAAGDAVRFIERSKARRGLTDQQELTLSLDAAELALQGLSTVEIDLRIAERRGKLIASQAALTDFRTFWDTIGQAFSGRPLVLIDSDRVPGQRNLFLIDPDLMRPVMPFLPQKKAPATKGEE
jgi:heavy metal translocating P-type ATPase